MTLPSTRRLLQAGIVGPALFMTILLLEDTTRPGYDARRHFVSLLSLGEDVLAVGISYGALQHPMIALTVAIILLVAIVFFASMIVKFVRRRFRRVHEAYSTPNGSPL